MSTTPPEHDTSGNERPNPDVLGLDTTTAVDAARRRRRRVGFGVAAGATVAIALFGGVATAVGVNAALQDTSSTESTLVEPGVFQPPDSDGYGGGGYGGYDDSGTSSDTLDVTDATAAQEVGVVTIDTTLYYGEGEAAGTGMILTSDGIILTNNHVVEGSTSIEVTVESTGETYDADVIGTDATADIAVLQLDDASGLDTVDLDTAATAVGDPVTSIGNAEGTGDLVAAAGTVSALDQSITVSDELTGDAESLSGLIEVDADVVSGDSGGPLLDADGEVTGIVTAASSGTRDVTGYAIPIATAMAVADQILAGDESGTVTLGLPAFLGVTVDSSATTGGGAVIAGVLDGLPAASAGIVVGDTITSIDGVAVTGYDSLSAIIDGYEAGDTVTVGITDASGAASTVTLTLVEGPAE